MLRITKTKKEKRKEKKRSNGREVIGLLFVLEKENFSLYLADFYLYI